jgi:hypothetical protein
MSQDKYTPTFNDKLRADTVAAIGAASSASIFVTMIDQAVTMNTSGSATMKESLMKSMKTFLTRPHKFLGNKAYLAVATVYTATYLAANYTNTFCEFYQRDSKLPKLASTSVTNISMGVTKDSLFAIWFGAGTATGGLMSVPLASWTLFILRDVSTMAAGFILPGMASDVIYEKKIFKKKSTCDIVAQLSVPMACQFFLTPMHLLALDMYNRPGETFQNRQAFVRSLFKESALLRCCRVGSIYGIAGISNTKIKKVMLEN